MQHNDAESTIRPHERWRNMFISAILKGSGFTVACESCGKTPKEVTDVLKKDPDFMGEMYEAKGESVQSVLSVLDSSMGKMKRNDLRAAKEEMEMRSRIILWESACTKEDVTEDTVETALAYCPSFADAATAVGMTYQEFFSYLRDRPYLSTSPYINSDF